MQNPCTFQHASGGESGIVASLGSLWCCWWSPGGRLLQVKAGATACPRLLSLGGAEAAGTGGVMGCYSSRCVCNSFIFFYSGVLFPGSNLSSFPILIFNSCTGMHLSFLIWLQWLNIGHLSIKAMDVCVCVVTLYLEDDARWDILNSCVQLWNNKF